MIFSSRFLHSSICYRPDINLNESDDSLEFTSSSEEDKPRRRRKQSKSKKSQPTFQFPKECPVCLEAVETKPEMIKHFETHIPVGEGSDAIKKAVKLIQSKLKKGHQYNMGWCEECKKLCMNFRGHFMACHTAILHKLCHHCGKVVKNARMEDHMICHMEVDESDYVQCPRCPLKFKHKRYLKAHTYRVHSLKRTQQCPTCGKMFKRANELSKHKVIHAATKPHPCSVCDKAFTQKSNLRIHMRQHTGDKPYVCDVCEAAFVNKVSLKNHKKKLHGIDWWKDREALKDLDPDPEKTHSPTL
ncbi:zinc finger protein 567-like [Lytechinus variegatus]|uniref:zinc finger protein 567-like n=1 Tax=Lytechinus variegatus TaxID=7654 RepID=UPI001BB2621E|nr:zinc finger protein 567-like [Lytechinus variegatus]